MRHEAGAVRGTGAEAAAAAGEDTQLLRLSYAPPGHIVGARDVSEAYAGLIDEVAVYDHALAAERVLAHFGAAGR